MPRSAGYFPFDVARYTIALHKAAEDAAAAGNDELHRALRDLLAWTVLRVTQLPAIPPDPVYRVPPFTE